MSSSDEDTTNNESGDSCMETLLLIVLGLIAAAICIPLGLSFIVLFFIGFPLSFFLVVAIPNAIVSAIYVFVAKLAKPHKSLDWSDELKYLKMLIRFKYHGADYLRANMVGLRKLKEHLKGHREQNAADESKLGEILRTLVKTQFDRVREAIEGGRAYIEVSETTTLSSVIMATLFFIAYVVYYGSVGYEVGRVVSKVHDALAIILPLLLIEELTASLSLVFLWMNRIANRYRSLGELFDAVTCNVFGDSNKKGNEDDDNTEMTPGKIEGYKVFFSQAVNDQSLSVGVGAYDMKSMGAFIASLWTLLFLTQAYIAEGVNNEEPKDLKPENVTSVNMTGPAWLVMLQRSINNVYLKQAANASLIPRTTAPPPTGKFQEKNIGTMKEVYVALLFVSVVLILFCYLPFIFAKRPEDQKKAFESISASCESHMFLERMSELESQLMKAISPTESTSEETTHAIKTRASQNHDTLSYYIEVKSPCSKSTISSCSNPSMYHLLRKLRFQALHQMDSSDIVSFTLYTVALSSYNFYTGQVGRTKLSKLVKEDQEEEKATNSPETTNNETRNKPKVSKLKPIELTSSFWSCSVESTIEHTDENDKSDESDVSHTTMTIEAKKVFPLYLLRIPGSRIEMENFPTMTLYSIPVMGVTSFEKIMMERRISHMETIYNNPLVQNKRVYIDKTRKLCIGLEVKVTQFLLVSIYIVAEYGCTFGAGPVCVTPHKLREEVTVVYSGEDYTFKEVDEEKKLLALASCTISLTPPTYFDEHDIVGFAM